MRNFDILPIKQQNSWLHVLRYSPHHESLFDRYHMPHNALYYLSDYTTYGKNLGFYGRSQEG